MRGRDEKVDIRRSVEDTAEEDQAAGDGFPADVVLGEGHALELGIVCAVEQDVVDAGDAHKQRDECQGGRLVLLEQALCPHEAAGDADEDDDGTEDGGPPADEQRWLIVDEGS